MKRSRPDDLDNHGDLDYYYPKLKKRKLPKRKNNEDDDDYDDDDSKKSTFSKFFLKGIGKALDSSHDHNKSVYSKDNHIYFHAGVKKDTIEKLIKLIEEKNKEYKDIKKNKLIQSMEPKPIYLHITSFGGSLLYCFKAVDAIERSKIPIHTIVEGYAASCGSLMAVVGKKRYMTPYASHLIHQLSSLSWGKFSELEDDYYNCKMWMTKIVGMYEQHSKMERSDIEKQLKHDSWWDSERCLSEGLVDELWN